MKRLALVVVLFISQSLAGADSFSVEVTGKGSPIVFIPGLTCSGEVWNDAVARYAEDRECHVLTLAGFAGAAPLVEDGPFLEKVAAELLAYLDEAALEKPLLVGHSLGGFVGLRCVTEAPDRFSGFVSVDSLPFLAKVYDPMATAETAKARALWMRASMEGNQPTRESLSPMLRGLVSDPEKFEIVLDWGLASDTRSTGKAMYEMMVTDLRTELAATTTPTIVLGSWVAYEAFGATEASTRALFEDQYRQHSHCEIRMSKAGRHFLMWDDPELLYGAMDQLLENEH